MICQHCGATILSSALAATPAVGGEALKDARIALCKRLVKYSDDIHCIAVHRDLANDLREAEACITLLADAAQPASPLRGNLAMDVFKTYEQWEADLIMENKCWEGREVPQLTGELWDRLLELQAMRNRALSASPSKQPIAQLTDEMIKAGTAAMIASDTPDGPAYIALARACLSAALGVDSYVAHKAATTPTEDPKE